MLLARRRIPRRREPGGFLGLGDASLTPAELEGALLVGSPGVDPIPAEDQAMVPGILEEAKAADAEIARLEAAIAAADATPAEEAALQARLADLQALAERVAALARVPPNLLALQAEAADKRALLDSLRASAGVSGLGSETIYPAAIPYIDMSNPAAPGWKIMGDPARSAQIAAGQQGVQFMDAPGWVLAAAGNAGGSAGSAPLRPVLSSLFSCPTAATWGPGQRSGQHARERLIADGLVRECATRYPSPIPAYYQNGAVVPPTAEPTGATTCDPGPRYAPSPWIDQGTLQVLRKGDASSPFSYLGRKYLQATPSTDFSTQKWLEAGAPEEFWVCVHEVTTGLPHFMREVAHSVVSILQNPYFSAAMILLMPMAGLSLAALMANAPAGAALPIFGAEAGARAALTQVVRVKVISDLATGNQENMSRTWARSIAAGFLVPGYGPIMAVIAPRQVNSFIQGAAANLFFTVPGFTSLVVYAETRKKKRDQLREELTIKQGNFYVKFHIGMIVRVVGAVVALVATILTLGALGPEMALLLTLLNTAVSVWDAMYQAEMTINGLTVLEKQLKAQNAVDLAAYDQAYRDLASLIAEMDAEIARLRAMQHGTVGGAIAGAVQSVGGFGLAALALAGILLLRRK